MSHTGCAASKVTEGGYKEGCCCNKLLHLPKGCWTKMDKNSGGGNSKKGRRYERCWTRRRTRSLPLVCIISGYRCPLIQLATCSSCPASKPQAMRRWCGVVVPLRRRCLLLLCILASLVEATMPPSPSPSIASLSSSPSFVPSSSSPSTQVTAKHTSS